MLVHRRSIIYIQRLYTKMLRCQPRFRWNTLRLHVSAQLISSVFINSAWVWEEQLNRNRRSTTWKNEARWPRAEINFRFLSGASTSFFFSHALPACTDIPGYFFSTIREQLFRQWDCSQMRAYRATIFSTRKRNVSSIRITWINTRLFVETRGCWFLANVKGVRVYLAVETLKIILYK